MGTMKAVRFHEYGGPDVLVYEDAPQPKPGPGEMLVRVHAASVNPVDTAVRTGYMREHLHLTLPAILGWDIAGEIEALGDGASRFPLGAAVYGMPGIRGGAYAEYIAVPEVVLTAKPASLDWTSAAAVPLAALTAWQALFEAANVEAGQRILIHAAAGGVGHIAVQLAKWKGAYVIGTASAANHGFVRELGANEVIDYTTQRFEEHVCDVDAVIVGARGDAMQRSWQVLKSDGVLVSLTEMLPSADEIPPGIRATRLFAQPSGIQLAKVAALIDAGHMRPSVQTVLPLAETRQAHELIQTGRTRGKIVLQVR